MILKDKKIIFVVGNSRSGTTMMSHILGLNKDVYTFQELHFFEQMVSPNRLSQIISKDEVIAIFNRLIAIEVEGFYKQGNIGIYTEESITIFDSYIKQEKDFRNIDVYSIFLDYYSHKKNKEIPCEQTPRNLFYVEEILHFLPNARIVNMIRDPRSVLLSQKNKWRRKFMGDDNMPLLEALRVWINYHPITISKLWSSALKVAMRHQNNPNFFHQKYEEFIFTPDKSIKKICDFCGIKFDAKMLDIPQIGSSVVRDRLDKKGIDKSRADSWKQGGLNDTEIYLAQKITKGAMQFFGYEHINVKPNYLYLLYYCLTFPLKIMLSFIINIGRMKNVLEALKRRF